MAASFGPALLGGACLGVSSVAVLAQTGGILGISGIVGCGEHHLSRVVHGPVS